MFAFFETLSEAFTETLVCPITYSTFEDAVITPAGITYDRSALAEYVNAKQVDPSTMKPLQLSSVYPNRAVRDIVQRAKSFGLLQAD